MVPGEIAGPAAAGARARRKQRMCDGRRFIARLVGRAMTLVSGRGEARRRTCEDGGRAGGRLAETTSSAHYRATSVARDGDDGWITRRRRNISAAMPATGGVPGRAAERAVARRNISPRNVIAKTE